ncbi:MAG: MarR family winged helix-turn-helix transcriptional regulator [Streptosporangiaceae bacterium]
MPPARDDVQSMVVALFTLTAGLERARRQRKAAGALSLLQVIAGRDGIRPSDIADLQLVHPSLITRQVRELEEAGYAQVTADPADGRSWLVALTPAGQDEMRRLQQVGLDRFALFVAGWEPGEVRALTALLDKLRTSMAAVGEREQRPPARCERPGTAGRRRRASRPETERQT